MMAQFLTDSNGKKNGAFLSTKDYKKLMEELEESDDIKTYDEAKKKIEKTIPLRDDSRLRKKESMLNA